MCKVLKVSRSSYYKHLSKKPSNREVENQMLGNEILDINLALEAVKNAMKIQKPTKPLNTL
jgi:hypothetical protein